MKIGKYDLYSVETSEFGLDGGAMFGIIPKPVWEKKVSADELNRVNMVTRSLLLVSDEKKILIDTGNGTKWEEKYKKIYDINTDQYNIEKSLGKYGFSSEQITDVICTHMHFDHIGGNTKIKSGEVVPTFPNAKYWISEENWKLANHPSQKDAGSFIEHDWKVLAENQMIEIIDGREPFIEGIETFVTHGHTPGLLHPIVSDGSNKLFYGADIFPMVAHIPIPWVMAYDVQPVVTMEEKQKLLQKMEREDWILFFEHDPHIQACSVHKDGKHYKLNKEIKISD
ncbi:MAG: MBL fold metallo-hydrolase [Candidatus Neomarinimicrobiota bacterium]|jgi:glyoxylase-like metal-dependent hydrolase (beta-lactamase superfamily II)|tara:strand:+ start:1411 stop:2259 length:849 start_codon:yes stop_codon:yes gene_type:complete